jgi:hypothetical protein
LLPQWQITGPHQGVPNVFVIIEVFMLTFREQQIIIGVLGFCGGNSDSLNESMTLTEQQVDSGTITINGQEASPITWEELNLLCDKMKKLRIHKPFEPYERLVDAPDFSHHNCDVCNDPFNKAYFRVYGNHARLAVNYIKKFDSPEEAKTYIETAPEVITKEWVESEGFEYFHTEH